MECLLNIQRFKDIFQVFHIYKRIKKEGLNKHDIIVLVKYKQRLKDLDYGVLLYIIKTIVKQ
jgi:hypothetical protein